MSSSDWADLTILSGSQTLDAVIHHHGVRVLDILNDPNSEFLLIHRTGNANSASLTSVQEEGVVLKSNIDCVLLTAGEHEAPMRRQHALVRKQPYPILAFLRNYSVAGTWMGTGRLNLQLLLGQAGSQFFPIIDATVRQNGDDHPSFTAPAVLVNRASVVLLAPASWDVGR